ncbi:MAG: hypothetical protein ACI81T_003520 [Bacteroidia bacterium]|jgi:hypothetical protein
MIGFYALGGGFGHLTRVKTFIENVQIETPYKVISTNENAYKFFNRDEVIFIPPSQAESADSLRNELSEIIEKYDFSEFYFDTFPCGIFGELDNSMFQGISLNCLSRRLKWDKYSALFPQVADMEFDKNYLFEPLKVKHEKFLSKNSQNTLKVELDYSWMSSVKSKQEILHRIGKKEDEIWLVVHTSDEEETQLLISQAQDISEIEGKKIQLIVLTNQEIQTKKNANSKLIAQAPACAFTTPKVLLLLNQNPIDWFPHASRIFTGAGFNTFYQLKNYRKIHECIPFPRKWDDQFWRANQE